MFDNPALTLYRFWREAMRFHAEPRVARERDTLSSKLNPNPYVNERASTWNGNNQWARLNYRLGLGLGGLSVRHLSAQEQCNAPIEAYEPILVLSKRSGYQTYPVMSLFPNGDFVLRQVPAGDVHTFTNWTFIRTAHAASQRVWMLPRNPDEALNISGSWSNLREKDWQTHDLYLPLHSFHEDEEYKLAPDDDGKWRFVSLDPNPGKYGARLLENGYAACFERYARYRRKSERAEAASRPRHPTVTPEQVAEFTQHLRVYPAPRP